MSEPITDPEFLALLVHHGRLDVQQAEGLMDGIRAGGEPAALFAQALGLAETEVDELRRTRCGEQPEIPGYRLIERLGRGGTADVWAATDLRRKRRVALKVLRPDLAAQPAALRAFAAEAKLLCAHPHENLVACDGAARAGATVFMRLEAIEGRTLLEHLDEGEPFEEGEALRIVLEVARVLEHLERQGVVHRDVKPGNVMLARDGRVVLIDLGLAVADKGQSSAPGAAAGTVAYLSPEEASGAASGDSRSDIYSLGVTLFHLLVGRLPFEGSDDREVLAKQIFASLESKELQGRGLSPHVQYFVEKMMSKDADDRYQSWTELIADVRAQVEGRETLNLKAPSQRPSRLRRRRR
ncbi:serine/threonine-protein kinase [Engelhardtia mirabilis]